MKPVSRSGTAGRPARRKALGQHHLRSGSLCEPLVEFLEPAGHRIVEIGPGGGVLTRELLANGARVSAWELDLAWAAHTSRLLGRDAVQMVVGDALDLPWEGLPAGTRVCGNLPYAVGTAIVSAMLARAAAVDRAAFLLQLEVVERLAAAPGTKAYGALSVLTAARAEVSILGRLGPKAFVPPPKVDSAFVGLRRRPAPLPEPEMAALTEVVYAAFAQRRKTLRNSLSAKWGRDVAESALAAAHISPELRAERLGLGEFTELAIALGKR